MPSSILAADTGFPDLSGDKSNEEKFGQITNYLYMLLEQLRYSLGNLGMENFNESALGELANVITQPVYVQLEGAQGEISALYVTAEVLSSRMEDAEGNISSLQQTAESLTSRLSDAEGNISVLQQSATSLNSRITDAEGNISNLQQTAQSLSSSLSSLEGDYSTLSQTVNSITLSVSNGESISTIQLLRNGVAVSSQSISFSGMVTFSDLSTSGATTINGDNIVTGTISAMTMVGNDIYGGSITGTTLRSVSGSDNGLEIYYGAVNGSLLVGGICFDDNGRGTSDEARYRMFIYTSSGYMDWAMKLRSAGGMSLESNDNIYIEAATNLTLRAGWNIWLENPAITDDDGNTWQFKEDGLYRNYVKVISLDGAGA